MVPNHFPRWRRQLTVDLTPMVVDQTRPDSIYSNCEEMTDVEALGEERRLRRTNTYDPMRRTSASIEENDPLQG